jgi:hypothetical protein
MYKIAGSVFLGLVSLSTYGMNEEHFARVTTDGEHPIGWSVLASSKIDSITLRELFELVVALLAKPELTDPDRKKAELTKSLIVTNIEEFLVQQSKCLFEKRTLTKRLEQLRKVYAVLETEQLSINSMLTLCQLKREDQDLSGSKTSSSHDEGKDLFAEFYQRRIELFKQEQELVENLSGALSISRDKLNAPMAQNLAEQEAILQESAEKENRRQDLSDMRHGCLLVLAILKHTVLKQQLTKLENDAFSEGSTIKEKIRKFPDFKPLLENVSL